MPLEILGPMVVLGIGGIALLMHFVGLSKPFQLTGEHSRTAWVREVPDDVPTQILIANNQENALLKLASGKLGLVHVMGADTTARYLTGATWHSSNSALTIHLPDFGAPKFTIPLSPQEQANWTALKDAAS
ncbi:hypothetical protein KO498_17370 [Lentibacter algarum]|uniref:hypothetical protein n=1 Tax=Lentibacter algarum TaxID=576131 RepID=UPI001C084071|nr:hypothetical protein [Lentibacter algarum]MBU2983581.1 hypothetical protein [Lentibacter algarum]